MGNHNELFRSRRGLVSAGLLFGVYVASGKLSLGLAFLNPSATAVWPNSGIALAAMLVLGAEIWPVILAGAFVVNFTTTGYWDTSLAIAAGNTAEAVVGAWLVNRFAGGRAAVTRASGVLKLTLFAAVLSTTISAGVGVTALALRGLAPWKDFGSVWLTWWLGDAVGDVIVAPLILLWISGRGNPWKWNKARFEAVILLAAVGLVGQVVFNGVLFHGAARYPIEYLCMPFLAWAGFRFGQREAAVTMVVLAGSAIWGTLDGFGPFARQSLNESLLLLQAFLGVCATLNHVLAVEIAERRRSEAEARDLSMRDSLTGLGNHRKLIDSLDAEIRRSDRSGRPFAVLFLDLDGLKRINDAYGHAVGNRALVRLAEVLTVHCRAGDAIARVGGDEFAVVLPETDRTGAHVATERIVAALFASDERPPLSTSVGSAVWPEDGRTSEDLLRVADRNLYEMKRARGGQAALPSTSVQ